MGKKEDDLEREFADLERGKGSASPPPSPPAQRATTKPPKPRKRRLGVAILSWLLLPPALIFAAWAALTLNFPYSSGERAGYVQKVSKKGWLCKTWEGELAMANLPGTMPQIFSFTVRDDSVAKAIQAAAGQRVSLTYAQHRYVPTTCFGETEYFVEGVRALQ